MQKCQLIGTLYDGHAGIDVTLAANATVVFYGLGLVLFFLLLCITYSNLWCVYRIRVQNWADNRVRCSGSGEWASHVIFVSILENRQELTS